MNLSELLQVGGGTLAFVAILAALIGNIFYVIRSKTNKLQKEQIEQLQKDNEVCTQTTTKLRDDLNHLQGQLDVLKDIPLQEIRDGIRDLKESSEKNLKANENIAIISGKTLDTLKSSAVKLERDTKEAKTAVRTVKADLQAA